MKTLRLFTTSIATGVVKVRGLRRKSKKSSNPVKKKTPMPDRTTAPEIREISDLKLPLPTVHTLDNGIPVYETRMGTQEILKLEILFYAGRPAEVKMLTARATASLLREGTENYTSADIAEQVDFYGGTLSTPVNLDASNVVLYSLTKHFEKLLAIVSEMVTKPVFPAEELTAFGERNIQRLSVDLMRTDVVAYRKITELIYGATHPYGYNSSEEAYRALTREDLVEHFERNYHAGNCKIFISGKITSAHIDLLNEYLGKTIPAGEADPPVFAQYLPPPQRVRIPHPESIQTAIRIGRRLFNRSHPDHSGMFVLNTVLGGYFGSRLMTNIREEKGYTYNIFSSHDPMMYDGYFYIGTEVSNDLTDKTRTEIYKELERIRTELIDDEELNMTKNYLLGNMLTLIDGPFNVADVVKTYIAEDLPVSKFAELVTTIKEITAEELRDLAVKYFKKEDMWEVIV